MTLILRSTEEQEWMEKHGGLKVEAVKEFGSGITIEEPRDMAALLDLVQAYKGAIYADLERQAKFSLGVSSEQPMALHLQVLNSRGRVKDSIGWCGIWEPGDTVELAFNTLYFEVPQRLQAGSFGRNVRRVAILGRGRVVVRVIVGLLYSQATVKQELMRAAEEHMSRCRPVAIEKLVGAVAVQDAPPKEERN